MVCGEKVEEGHAYMVWCQESNRPALCRCSRSSSLSDGLEAFSNYTARQEHTDFAAAGAGLVGGGSLLEKAATWPIGVRTPFCSCFWKQSQYGKAFVWDFVMEAEKLGQ